MTKLEQYVLKKICYYCTIMFIVLLCACSSAPSLYDLNHHLITLKNLQHHWVIVNYWADWCENCKVEIPKLNQLYQQSHHKNLTILSVNFDNLSEKALQQAVVKNHIQYPVLTGDPNQLWHLGPVEVLPTTFIIDPQGKVVAKLIGPQSSESLLHIMATHT